VTTDPSIAPGRSRVISACLACGSEKQRGSARLVDGQLRRRRRTNLSSLRLSEQGSGLSSAGKLVDEGEPSREVDVSVLLEETDRREVG